MAGPYRPIRTGWASPVHAYGHIRHVCMGAFGILVHACTRVCTRTSRCSCSEPATGGCMCWGCPCWHGGGTHSTPGCSRAVLHPPSVGLPWLLCASPPPPKEQFLPCFFCSMVLVCKGGWGNALVPDCMGVCVSAPTPVCTGGGCLGMHRRRLHGGVHARVPVCTRRGVVHARMRICTGRG